MHKILDRKILKDKLEALRKEGKKIAFTNGCFDILHVGHVRYLKEAKKTADILVLALNSDASIRAIKKHKKDRSFPEKKEQKCSPRWNALILLRYLMN